MKVFKCALVEDSNVHRILLEQIIGKHPNLELYGSFGNSAEALKTINSSTIDLLFLDIEMPILNGFDFLEGLQITPQVIITSQHPKYALDAFDYNVTDFLLKPFTKNRFDIALKKAIDKASINALNTPEDKLVVKHNLKQVEVNIHTIHWVEALGDYIKIITPERNYVVLSTMSAFYKKLRNEKFLRIHKSYIINLKMVERYNHEFIEIRGKKIPISRNKNIELDRLLNCVG